MNITREEATTIVIEFCKHFGIDKKINISQAAYIANLLYNIGFHCTSTFVEETWNNHIEKD